jgi:TonB family protein
VAIKEVRPELPKVARFVGGETTVILNALVQKDGTVRLACVADSTTKDRGLEESALEAIRQWRFTPAMRDGVPVDAIGVYVFDFSY